MLTKKCLLSFALMIDKCLSRVMCLRHSTLPLTFGPIRVELNSSLSRDRNSDKEKNISLDITDESVVFKRNSLSLVQLLANSQIYSSIDSTLVLVLDITIPNDSNDSKREIRVKNFFKLSDDMWYKRKRTTLRLLPYFATKSSIL